jgi:hypothetical protein
MYAQPQQQFDDGSFEDKKDVPMGGFPVNELNNDNATVKGSIDETASFEQQQGVTRIEALCE